MRLIAFLIGTATLMAAAAILPELDAAIGEFASAGPGSRVVSPEVTIPLGDRETDDEDILFDLEGQQISPALAKYFQDSRGKRYEVHSPRTELPRLSSPKT